jgi:tetratricopeptide (TPR) repeat protein
MSAEEGEPSNDPNMVDAKQALDSKDFKKAVTLLEKAAAADPRNANVQNYLGYAHRNLGHYDLAVQYYERALNLSPGHRGAREYAGEAYLAMNNLSKAEEQLAMLDQICMTGCDELKQLKDKIAEFKKKNRK